MNADSRALKARTLRLPEQDDEAISAIAASEGISVNEAIIRAIRDQVEVKRNDPEFQGRLKEILKRNQRLYDRLAKT